MNSELIQKAIELIEKSEHLAILLPDQPSLDCLAAAEVLAAVLEEQNKQVNFLSFPQRENIYHKDSFPRVSAAKHPPKEFIISLDATYAPIAELRYEKLENGMDIIVSPKSSSIKKEFVSFHDGRMLCDCAILMGVHDVDTLQIHNVRADFFTTTPLINIDASENNKQYGEVNLIDINRVSVSELVYDFISASRERPLEKELATLLLAGMMSQTDGFRSVATNADTLLTASELLRLNASRTHAYELAKYAKPLGLIQFLGRAAIRTKIDRENDVTWSFLTQEDFEKTGCGDTDTVKALDYLHQHFPLRKALVLLWQSPQESLIHVMLSAHTATLAAIQAREPGEFQSPYMRLSATFSSFREAEEYLGSLLKATA